MQIPQQTIDTIRDRTDIVEVVSQYVELKRVGRRLVGLCPFHQEKSPSFGVDADKQLFHCFGCSRGGNVFNFLMEMEGVSFVEAVRTLGQRSGVPVELKRESPGEASRAEAFTAANAFAARFYHGVLTDRRTGARAQRYLLGRGIPENAWRRFGLGFAPDAWDRFWSAARREGVDEGVLSELRLITRSDKSKGYYDYFRNRIMFPIISVSGRVIGFGARVLGDEEPKYLNSAESAIFQKRRTFYGIDRARDAIRSKREALVVEGYTDLISLHMAGFTHAVASCGTALTPEHAALLRRLTQRAVLVPDGDLAGENAAVSSGAILLAVGVDVAVARLPQGMDPDSAVREQGTTGMAKTLENAGDYFGFVRAALEERKSTPRQKEDLIQRVLSGVSHLDDRLRRDVILNELARVFSVDPVGLKLPRVPGAGVGKDDAGGLEGGRRAASGRAILERLALRLIMEGTPVALDAIDTLDSEDFSDDRLIQFYKTLDSARETHIDIRSREFQHRVEEAGLAELAAEIALLPLPPGNLEVLLRDTIRRIKELNIRDELSLLRKKLQELPPESEEAVAVAEYYFKLKQALVDL